MPPALPASAPAAAPVGRKAVRAIALTIAICCAVVAGAIAAGLLVGNRDAGAAHPPRRRELRNDPDRGAFARPRSSCRRSTSGQH